MKRTWFKRVAAPPAPIDLNPRTDPALDFPWRAASEMTPQDYAEIGFLCGLEVHQQLATRRKLFCRCPADVRTDRVDAEVLRHMRPTLSEMGLYDGCALMEFKTRKEIVYLLSRACVCTYEMDDTPPFEIDEEAVRSALGIARLFDMSLVSELQVMRKQYLDGSIPTGFQRTGMIAVGGSVPLRASELGRDGVLRLRQLTLEEDSCREVSDVGHRIVFRTDRLGAPLIETVTEPDLLTPRDAEAGGRLLAAVAHASGRVRRGPGAARQDVNVSVAGSRRIEIKGVPSHRAIPRLVHVEAFRQLELLRIREELRRRGVTPEMLRLENEATPWESANVALAADAVRPSACAPLRTALERGQTIVAVRLPRFAGLLAHRTQPGVTFAQEFTERLRVIACLADRPFLAHSDDPDGVEAAVWERVRALLGAEAGDALVLAWGDEDDAATAAREIALRAEDALVGVPSETRQAYGDGTTGLERILPGPERMYPDTDTPPVRIRDAWVADLDAHRPELPWERELRYEALGLPEALARRLADAPWAAVFDACAPAPGDVARRLAWALEKRVPHLLRAGVIDTLPDAGRIAALVRDVEAGRVRPEAFEPAFDELARSSDDDPEALLDAWRVGDDDAQLLEARIEAVRALPRSPFASDEGHLRRSVGEVLPYVLGRAAPDVVHRAVADALARGPEDAR